jgi:hypothetical protein
MRSPATGQTDILRFTGLTSSEVTASRRRSAAPAPATTSPSRRMRPARPSRCAMLSLRACQQTAKLNDIDPQAWLADVLGRINDQSIHRLDELLPWSWAAEIERCKMAT